MMRALAGLKKRGIRDFVAAAAAFRPGFSLLRPLDGLAKALERHTQSFFAGFFPPSAAKAA
jgi:hypothetical protein